MYTFKLQYLPLFLSLSNSLSLVSPFVPAQVDVFAAYKCTFRPGYTLPYRTTGRIDVRPDNQWQPERVFYVSDWVPDTETKNQRFGIEIRIF